MNTAVFKTAFFLVSPRKRLDTNDKHNCISNVIVKMEEVLNPGAHETVLLGHTQVRQLSCINWL